jgi:Fe-S cluster biogenesis protein NfuA
MTSERETDATSRLEGIADALRADGYSLVVEGADETLHVRIAALDGACEECLVPPVVLTGMLSSALGGDWPPERISVTYPTG